MALRTRVFPASAVVLVAMASAGCRAELGECDSAAAQQVAFLDTGVAANAINGVPMYAGQALMYSTCGAGQFCHTGDANAVERYGVPEGLFFDVQYGCEGPGPCTETDTPEMNRLARDQAAILDYAREILTSVRNGRMPPGGIGERVVEEGGRFRIIDDEALRSQDFTLYTQRLSCANPLTSCSPGETSQVVDTQFLPAVGTREGNEILRNWLACGAPVVESTATEALSAGTNCNIGASPGHPGDCVNRIPLAPEVPAQSWTSIYEKIIGPLCGESCHGPGSLNQIEESGLDLSSKDLAYSEIVGVVAEGEACAGMGTLVVPGSSATSLFIDKLRPDPSCGAPMPDDFAVLPEEVVAVIRAWIDDGAPND